MKTIRWITMLSLVILLVSCSQMPTATPAPTSTAISPDAGTSSPGNVTAKGAVVPIQQAQMSFTLSGPAKEVAVQAGDKVRTGQTLVALDMPDLDGAVAEAEAALRAAELEWEYWIPPRKNRPPERRQLAWAEVLQAQASLATAQAALAQATLVAPFDGTVVAIHVAQGEYVAAGQVIVTLGELNRLQVETTDLSERDVPNVKIGQAATVYVEALDQEIRGRVVAISPLAEAVGGDVVYKVTIELDQQPQSLRWGMSAKIEIRTGEQ